MYGFNSFYCHFLIVFICYGYIVHKVSVFILKEKQDRSFIKKMEVFFMCMPLFFLGAFRGITVGGDLENYIPQFENMSHIRNFEEFNNVWRTSLREPGYLLLTLLINKICPDSRGFLLVTSFISLVGPAYLIYKYSPKILLSFYLYYSFGFYTNTYNNIRQSIALSICFVSITALFDKRIRKFMLLVIAASLFHYSAIFFSLIYPLVNCRFKLKRIVLIIVGATIIFYFSKISVMSTLIQIMSFKYDANLIDSHGNKGWLLFIFYMVILLSEIYLYKWYQFKSQRKSCFIKNAICFQTLCCIFQMYASIFPSMTRLSFYFFIPIIFIVPNLIKECKRFREIIYVSIIMISILFLKMTYTQLIEIRSNSQGVIPYVFLDTTIY